MPLVKLATCHLPLLPLTSCAKSSCFSLALCCLTHRCFMQARPASTCCSQSSLQQSKACLCLLHLNLPAQVKRCPLALAHSWSQCPFAHAGERATRRDPLKFQYSATMCPDYKKASCHACLTRCNQHAPSVMELQQLFQCSLVPQQHVAFIQHLLMLMYVLPSPVVACRMECAAQEICAHLHMACLNPACIQQGTKHRYVLKAQ